MRLRLSSRVKDGRTIQRVAFEVPEEELKYVLGNKLPEHPRFSIHCEHGVLRVRAPTAEDPGYSMWLGKGTKQRMWCSQLNVSLFPNINWAHYATITEVVVRRTNKELHTLLTQLEAGETLAPPVIRPRAPRGRATRASQSPAVSNAVPTAAPTLLDAPLPPEEHPQGMQMSDTDRTMLRTAMDVLNAQHRRGTIKLRVDNTGELRVDVVRIRVEMEQL